MPDLLVYKERTNSVQVDLGMDVSADTITSEVRADRTVSSELLFTWDVNFVTDGEDGLLVLTVDDSLLQDITAKVGWMDLKRVSAGEELPVFRDPIKVRFRDAVTA